MTAVLRNFEAANPDIQVKAQYIGPNALGEPHRHDLETTIDEDVEATIAADGFQFFDLDTGYAIR